MTDWKRLNATKRRMLAALTRAKNAGDGWKILAAVTQARLAFERDGFPDQWPTWTVALADCEWADDPGLRARARIEADKWH